MRRLRAMRSRLLIAAALASAACTRGDTARATDSARDSAVAQAAANPPADAWDSELGALLVVPSDSDNVGVVVYPDAPTPAMLAASGVMLVSPAGDSARIRLAAQDSQQCGDAATVRLQGSAPAAWTVGLAGRTAKLLRTDSIEALPAADSARLAADLARLASALAAPRDSRFAGVPFAVVSARRFSVDGRQFLVAHLVRRLNQEAAPLEERTFLIAERSDSAARNERYATTFSRRSEGTEDTAEHFEVLTVARGRSAPVVLIARDQMARTTYELLERAPDGSWRSRWSRALSC
jgi:hypothetical protein